MDISIPCSRRIKELIANGVITVGVHIARDGTDVWARSTQSHPRLGVQACTSYTLEDIEHLLAKVSVQPLRVPEGAIAYSEAISESAKAAAIGASSSSRSKDLSGPTAARNIGFNSIDQAINYVVVKQLDRRVNEKGVVGYLAKDSLTPADLDRPAKHLYARTCAIVEKLTVKKILSRIASQPVILSVKGAATLAEWWSKSTSTQKACLLTRSSLFQKDGSGQVRLHGYWLDKLDSLPCPFRDAEAQVVQHEEGPSAEEKDSYSSADDLP